MFVRFRQGPYRLQLSVVENHRLAGKVHHEHIASLGSISIPSSLADRIAFWTQLHQRLARLSNRIDPKTQGKIYGGVHARIPMPTPAEQRALQEENAKADEKFWLGLRDMHAEKVEGTKGLIATAERNIAASQAAIAEADVKTAAAKERLHRLARGEPVAGGLDKPMVIEDALKAAGWTASDLRRALLSYEISKAGGDEMLMAEVLRRPQVAENCAHRAVAAKLGISTKK